VIEQSTGHPSAKVILATQSAYKKALFARLNIAFTGVAANIDESPHTGETALALAKRLALGKAEKIRALTPSAEPLIIGADQVAICNGRFLEKPMTHEQAVADLMSSSGNTATFYTVAAVLTDGLPAQLIIDKTCVNFRSLTQQEIDQYLKIEKPYDCAGAFKAEGLGISLFDSIESQDPTALIGLPLIQLSHCLREAGFDPYSNQSKQ